LRNVKHSTRVLALVALAAASCGDGGAALTEITDTSGARFAWHCTDHCRPEIEDGTPALPPCRSGSPLYTWDLDRFINISASCTTSTGGWISAGNLSRLVACDVTSDCPQFTGPSHAYVCRNGICQSSDLVTYPPDYVTWVLADELCYAALPREDTIDPTGPGVQQVSAWVASACPSTGGCTLPLPGMCMQP